MTSILLRTLTQVLPDVPLGENTAIERSLLTITETGLYTPAGDMFPRLTSHKSRLPDSLLEFDVLKELLGRLAKNKSLIRLDHIGFCYRVVSQAKEKERLMKKAKISPFHLYQEPSNDEGLWLFMGDITNWEAPVLEFVPIESTEDKWRDYWLPHVQIDLDTTLSGDEIIRLVKKVCGKKLFPFPIRIGREICIVRNRLGTLEGVNVVLDLATTARDVRSLREVVWKKIA